MYLGKRRGYMTEPMKPHSLGSAFIGACLLWWLVRFQCGQRVAASPLAPAHSWPRISQPAAAALGWMFAEWIKTASQVCWAQSQAQLRDWWPSRPHPDS